jgi:hypothetical protein
MIFFWVVAPSKFVSRYESVRGKYCHHQPLPLWMCRRMFLSDILVSIYEFTERRTAEEQRRPSYQCWESQTAFVATVMWALNLKEEGKTKLRKKKREYTEMKGERKHENMKYLVHKHPVVVSSNTQKLRLTHQHLKMYIYIKTHMFRPSKGHHQVLRVTS